MKKILLSLSLMLGGTAVAQPVYSYGFDGTTADLITAGFVRTNQSTSPSATALWTIPTYAPVVVSATTPANAFGDQVYTTGQTSPVPNGQAGGGNSFALVNFASTTSTSPTAATISNWLITPEITVQNGDVVTFWSRKGTSGTTDYPDRLELRMSTATPTVQPSTGPTDVGSFTVLATSVNPNLLAGFVYPKVWTQYSYTVAGVTGLAPVKFAFRYHVTAAGSNGANSDIIGIDSFLVDRTLSTSDFFKSNFAMYPNPASDVLNITTNGITINAATITDINGRIVGQQTFNEVDTATVNVGSLNSGVYFISVETADGKGTAKFVKN